MNIKPDVFGARIKMAREACQLSQEDVAQHLMISRASMALIEAGKRAISPSEMLVLAKVLNRDADEFLATDFQQYPDLAPVLFRKHPDVADAEAIDTVREGLELGRALSQLERLLGINREAGPAAKYNLPEPSSRWEAIQQGEYLADEERRRLGIGNMPLGDMSDFLESQGVRVAVENLPDEISGLVQSGPAVGVFVMINRRHSRERRRFSHAHEYAHVLADIGPDRPGLISVESDKNTHAEVRANTFAACFLMPAEGVRQLVGSLGKGRTSRFQGEVFDGNEAAVMVEGRSDPRSQDIQLYDVLHMAHHFGVSVPAALYRLRNLRLISEGEFDRLTSQNREVGRELAEALGIRLPEERAKEKEKEARDKFRRRFGLLAFDAYRRKLIARDRLIELGKHCELQDQVNTFLCNEELLLGG